MDLLQEAGLLDAIQAQHFLQKFGAVFLRDGEASDFDFSDQFTSGWDYTYQVPRADFDKALADAVAARGVPVLTATESRRPDFARRRQRDPRTAGQIAPQSFRPVRAGLQRLRTRLPRLLKLEKPSGFPLREALFTHVTGDRRPAGREEGKIWVCLHPGGAWIWIIPFSNDKTSVGVVAGPEFFRRYPGDPGAQLRAALLSDPNAAARLARMKFVFPPRAISGYACAVKEIYGPQFALVGNAAEFLDPVFSSGVTLALASASRAAQVMTRHLRGQPVDWQTEYADYVMQGINTFRAYVTAWYDGRLPRIFLRRGATRSS